MKEVGVKIVDNVLHREWNYLGIKTWNSLRDELNEDIYTKLLVTLNPYRSKTNLSFSVRTKIMDAVHNKLQLDFKR